MRGIADRIRFGSEKKITVIFAGVPFYIKALPKGKWANKKRCQVGGKVRFHLSKYKKGKVVRPKREKHFINKMGGNFQPGMPPTGNLLGKKSPVRGASNMREKALSRD